MGDLIPAVVTPTPAAPVPAHVAVVQEVAPAQPVEAPDAEGFKSKESKDAVLSDLMKARNELQEYKDREAEAERAKLSDIDRANAETAAARKEADDARAEALRLRIAAKHGISDEEDMELFLTGADEETLTRQAERLAARSAGNPIPPNTPKPDLHGGPRNEKTGTLAEQIAAAEAAGDKSATAVLKAQQLGALANNRT